ILISSSFAKAPPAAKTAAAPRQVVSRKLRIRALPATSSRVDRHTATPCRASAPDRWEEFSGSVSQLREALGHGSAPPSLRRNVRIPVELTPLKPETIKSLRLGFFDRNKNIVDHRSRIRDCFWRSVGERDWDDFTTA